MRQFLLASAVAYTAATSLNAIANGAIGFFYNDNGVLKVTATGEEITREGMLALGRAATSGGPIVLPIHRNHFTYVKGEYQVGTKFKGTVTIPAPGATGEFSLIIAKKGVGFNERNKWTASKYVNNSAMTAANLATALAEQINNNSEASGVKATAAAAVLTIDGVETGVDFALIPADKLSGATVATTTNGFPSYGDSAYIIDLANKAAADAGFNYTYDDANSLYPNYPLNPLAQPNSADVGFTIFTLRFAEPRDVKTRDEIVHQIVQVAFPTGAAAIATFEAVCQNLSGVTVEEGV